MISFRDYLTETPKILCGIPHAKKNSDYLFEELHAEPYQFMVPKDRHAKYEGRVIRSGIMHVRKFGQGDRYLVHRGVDQEPIEFKDRDAAYAHAEYQKAKEHKSVASIHDGLMRHYYQTHVMHETPLKMYGSGSVMLNNDLLSGGKPPQALKLDHALNHKPTPDDMFVYSGISTDHATKILTSDVVRHPSFLSTSLNMDVASCFSIMQGSNHILKIHVPSGHRGAYIGDISAHKHEREFLLPRGLNLRIHRDKEVIMKGNELNVHIHHATIEP